MELTNDQLKAVSLIVFTLQNAAFVLLMRLSQVLNSHYNTTVAVLITEILKLPFSLALLTYELGGPCAAARQIHKDIISQPMDTLKISVPVILSTER